MQGRHDILPMFKIAIWAQKRQEWPQSAEMASQHAANTFRKREDIEEVVTDASEEDVTDAG